MDNFVDAVIGAGDALNIIMTSNQSGWKIFFDLLSGAAPGIEGVAGRVRAVSDAMQAGSKSLEIVAPAGYKKGITNYGDLLNRIKDINTELLTAVGKKAKVLISELGQLNIAKTNFEFNGDTGVDKSATSGMNKMRPIKGLSAPWLTWSDDFKKKIIPNLREHLKLTEDITAEWVQNMNKLIGDSLGNLATDVASALGEAFASGNWSDFGRGALNAIGRFCQMIGSALIAFGVAMSTFLKGLDPATKIAAGIALVAIGSFISKKAAAGPSMSGAGGSGNYGGYASSQSYSPMQLQIYGYIRGQDIYYSTERYKESMLRR
jgi:hypothetical protein